MQHLFANVMNVQSPLVGRPVAEKQARLASTSALRIAQRAHDRRR